MKITGYRVCATHQTVSVCETATATVDFDTALAANLGSLEPLPATAFGATRNTGRLPNEPWEKPAPFRYRDEAGAEVEVVGGLFYENVTDMMHFLLERYVPGNRPGLDRRVARAQAGDAAERGQLERMVLGSSEFHPRRRREGEVAPEAGPPIVKASEFLESNARRAVLDDGEYWLPYSEGMHAYPVLTVDHEVAYGRHRLPRRSILLTVETWGDGPHDDGVKILHFDGVQPRWYRHRDDLPEKVVRQFDQEGRAHRVARSDLYPLNHLRARCLMRVPGRADLEALRGAAAKVRRPRAAALARPALTVETRDPIELPRGLPVIADPAAALWVVQRVTNGIYLPGEKPAWPDPAALPDAPTYLCLCDPAVVA